MNDCKADRADGIPPRRVYQEREGLRTQRNSGIKKQAEEEKPIKVRLKGNPHMEYASCHGRIGKQISVPSRRAWL